MNVLLFTSPKLGIFVFDALRQSGHNVVGLFTQKSLLGTALTERARTRGVPIFTPMSKRTLQLLAPSIKKLHPTILVIAAYGIILPKEILDSASHGGLNIHFSALPKYRGPNPVPHAILDGEQRIAISIVRVTPKVDDGPIIAQHWETIERTATGDSLYNRLCPLAADLLVSILPDYLAGNIPGMRQRTTGVSYARHLKRADGKIDLAAPPADLARRIRAFHSWPGIWAEMEIKGRKTLLKLLPGKLFQIEGKKPVSLPTLVAGYPEFALLLRPVLRLLEGADSP